MIIYFEMYLNDWNWLSSKCLHSLSSQRPDSFKIIIIVIITCYLSTPFIILQIHKGASRVVFTNFLNAHPLTRPHPHAVRRKVIIISNCRLVPYWREFLKIIIFCFCQIICHPFQLFLLLEELSNITYSSLLNLTVVQNLVRSNQLNVSHFVIQRQLMPMHRPETPCRPSKGIPSERLRLVEVINFA